MVLTFARIENLAVVRTIFGAVPRYVVSDITAARHLAISAQAYRLLARLDGVRSPAEAAQGLAMDSAEVAAVLKRLLGAGLVKPVGAGVASGPVPAARAKGPVKGRYLFMRCELFELMPVLPAIDRVFGSLFKPVGVALWTILGLTALLRLASRIESADLFSWAQQFSTAEAFALFLVFFGLKLVHELGRAVALRRMAAAEGLPLHSVRAGVALMLLAPFPFTNASAAWGLASKWRRVASGCRRHVCRKLGGDLRHPVVVDQRRCGAAQRLPSGGHGRRGDNAGVQPQPAGADGWLLHPWRPARTP